MGLFDAFKFTMTLDSKSYQNSMKRANAATALVNKNTSVMNKQIKTIDRQMKQFAKSVNTVSKSFTKIDNSSKRAVSSLSKMSNNFSKNTRNITNNLKAIDAQSKSAFNGLNSSLRSSVNAVNSMAYAVSRLNSQMQNMSNNTQVATATSQRFTNTKVRSTKAVKTFNTSMVNSKKSTNQYVGGISEAYNATDFLGSAISRVVRIVRTVFYFEIAGKYVKSLTTAYMEQESALVRLNKLMKNVYGTTHDDVQAIADYSKELAKSTTFARDAIQVGASQLSTFFLQKESIEELLPAYADLLTGIYGVNVTQKEAIHGANLLGKAFAGLPGMLRRWGVMLSKEQADLIKTGTEAERVAVLVDVLKMNFGGLSEAMAQTREGQLAKLKVDLRELSKIFGAIVMPIIDKSVANLSRWSGALVELLSEPTKLFDTLQTKFMDFYKGLSKGAKAVILFASSFMVLKFTAKLINDLTSVTMIFFKVFTGGGNPVFTFLIGFYAIFTAIRAIMETLGVDTAKWTGSLEDAAKAGKELGSRVIKWTFVKAGEMWNWLENVWTQIKPDVDDLVENIFATGKKTTEWIIETSGKAWEWFEENKIDIIKGLIDTFEWFFNTATHATTLVLNASGTLWDAGVSVWNSLEAFIGNIMGLGGDTAFNISLGITDAEKFQSLFTGIFGAILVKKLGATWGTTIAIGLTLAGLSAGASKIRKDYIEYAKTLEQEVNSTIQQGTMDYNNGYRSAITDRILAMDADAKAKIRDIRKEMITLSESPQSLFTDIALIGKQLGIVMYEAFSYAFIEGGKMLDKFIVTPIEKFIDLLLTIPNKIKNAWDAFWGSSEDYKQKSDFLKQIRRDYENGGSIIVSQDWITGNATGRVPEYASGRVKESGVISGKGTGKSDSILAKVSNGEAIINAQSTQKYLPLLRAINEDKLPGFQQGNLESSSIVMGGNSEVTIVGVQGSAKSFFQDVMDNAISIVEKDFTKANKIFEKFTKEAGMEDKLKEIEDLIKGMDVVKEMDNFTHQIEKGFDELMSVSSETLEAIREQSIQQLSNLKGQFSSMKSIEQLLGESWADKIVDSVGGFTTRMEDIFAETDPTKKVGEKKITEKIKENPAEQWIKMLEGKYQGKDTVDEAGNVIAEGTGIDMENLITGGLADITGFISEGMSGLIGGFTNVTSGLLSMGSTLPLVGGAFGVLAGIVSTLGTTLLGFVAPLAILIPIVEGIFSVLQPILDRVLKPIMGVLKSFGEAIGALIAIFIQPLMYALTPIIWLFNALAWALDQFILWVNDLPFVGGFLNASQIKEKRKSIDERQQEYAVPAGSTDKTIEGEQFKAGSTRQTVNNINVTFKENIMLTDDKPAIKRFSELLIDYMRENVDTDFAM